MLAVPRLLATTSAFVVPPLRVVLVFIPGIMGSRLELPGLDWDPDSSTNMLDWMALSASAMKKNLQLGKQNAATLFTKARGLSQAEEDRGWGQVSQDFYGKFLKSMQAGLDNAPLPIAGEVWAAGYDWRMPNKVSAGAVLQRIQEVVALKNPDRTILVTHSMGGLVSRHITSRKSAAALIEGVIHIGQPVTGAPVAYRRLLGGAPRKVDGQKIDGVMRFILGKNAETVAEIVSGTPSFFELLPTDDYRHSPNPADFWLRERAGKTEFIVRPAAGENIYDLYQKDRWPPSAIPKNLPSTLQDEIGSRIRSARKAHDALAGDPVTGTPPQRHVATWSLLSSREMTDVTVMAEHRGGTKAPEVDFIDGREKAGDGTVPAASASALFPGEGGPLRHTPDPMLSRQFFVDGLIHDVMCEDPDLQLGLQQLIFAILAPPSLATPGGGRITFDENLIWPKLFEIANGGALESEAEVRVAKFFAQNGHNVHLLKERPIGLTPDMRVSGIGNVEVKRLLQVDTPDGRDTLHHAMEQVEFDGGGGAVVVVHSRDAVLDFNDYRDVVHDTIHTRFNGNGRGVVDIVVAEDSLPPIFQGP